VKACHPVWASVTGEFTPRGGISTRITASWTREDGKAKKRNGRRKR
jgi:NADPH-dependent 7-cyano-7-deazaguanine reductase QueF